MGQTFQLACTDCKVYLWIGQTNAASHHGWLYTADHYPRALWAFLRRHQDHNLKFVEMNQIEDDWKQLVADNDPDKMEEFEQGESVWLKVP